ncbi:MAG: hypothetical protein RL516_918 [Bacteroidota bacterium]|jgi:hypothetical protein
MKKILFFLLCSPVFLFAQSDTILTIPSKDEPADIFSAGLGFGQDLGGIGANLTYYATKRLGFQGGLGYAMAGIGYNAGVKYRFLKGANLTRRTPFFTAMYGYNAAIKVKNLSEKNKLFYGPSLGFGFDSKALGTSHTYWSFAIYYPFRSNEVSNYMEDLKKNYGVVFNNDLFPITLSISYKMIIK